MVRKRKRSFTPLSTSLRGAIEAMKEENETLEDVLRLDVDDSRKKS